MNTSFVKERLDNLNLKPSETRIIGVRPTKNAMELLLVFAERVERPSSRKALADFNASDERFGNSNAQPVWMKAMLADVAVLLPEAVDACKQAIEEQDYVSLDILNPTLNGKRLRIEIKETHKPSKRQVENIEISAKQDGLGNYLHRYNLAIFVSTDVVKGEPQHQFIQHTGTTKDVYELNYSTEDYGAEVSNNQQMEDAVFERKNKSNQRELV
ncbi:MAG: hypothetical protein WD604_06725 [Balneolaceae bacterium]